jgi:hypothetical protein
MEGSASPVSPVSAAVTALVRCLLHSPKTAKTSTFAVNPWRITSKVKELRHCIISSERLFGCCFHKKWRDYKTCLQERAARLSDEAIAAQADRASMGIQSWCYHPVGSSWIIVISHGDWLWAINVWLVIFIILFVMIVIWHDITPIKQASRNHP